MNSVEDVRRPFGHVGRALRMHSELFRYLSVGVVNMVVGLSTIYLCMYLLHATDLRANGLGYCAGVVCSFVLNRRWTFASNDAWVPQFVRFLVVLGIAYAANVVTVLGLVGLGTNRYLAQALGTVPYTAFGYIGSRLFAFRR